MATPSSPPHLLLQPPSPSPPTVPTHPSPSNPNSPLSTSPLQIIPSSSISSPPKKSPPLPWTHQETLNLIQSYQDKWYSLKKGQLKASQWEEVAVTVAARCAYDEPSKTATQCRHKIEKLRKRYRSEKLKPFPNNSWPLFTLMDHMERGPMPISYQNPNETYSDDNNSDDYNGYKSKSINHIVGNNSATDRVLRRAPKRKADYERYEYGDEYEEEDEDEEGDGDELAKGLGAEIRAFSERFVRMENKKIEMMRETERYRMEMENKRMQMILNSQKKLVDTINRAFSSHNKMKMSN